MIDAFKWRDLTTVNLLVCVLGSTIFATLSRASCTVIIVTSGVSGIVQLSILAELHHSVPTQ